MISNSKLEKYIHFFYRSVSQSWRPFLQGNLFMLSQSLSSVLEYVHYNFNLSETAFLLIDLVQTSYTVNCSQWHNFKFLPCCKHVLID